MVSKLIRGKSSDMSFYPSEKFSNEITVIFWEIQNKINALLPEAEVLHIGGSSIPGAVTKGDLDIQVRVGKSDMPRASTALKSLFEPNNMELWNGELAIFRDELQYHWKIDILMTAIGSADDDCFKFRNLLLADLRLLEEYNNIKIKHTGGVFKDYKKEKDLFYAKLKRIVDGAK